MTVQGEQRDPEKEKWRADLAARMFGQPAREVKIGRYTVLSRVGDGAAGVVYAAHDRKLDRKVALKVLRGDAALPPGRAAQWLEREAKILARLSHPNVVPVYDVGEDQGQVFIALELVEGRALRSWMAESHGWAEVVAVFAQAGAGLAAAHAAGLVHRDFKPENVLLGDDGRVRVSDFGIARQLVTPAEEVVQTEASGEVSLPGAPMAVTTHRGAGTPGYMAPEQFLGDPVDARIDQFGFCVALHEALYGHRPFAGQTRAGLAANVIAGRRRAGSPGSGVPKWLDRVVARGLEVDPERRYPSMDALVADLERRRSGRGRWLVGAALGAGLMGAGFVAAAMLETPNPCEGGEAKLAAVWDVERAQRIDDAFSTTTLPYAQDSARRVRESIDDYGRDWVQIHGQVCEGVSEDAVLQRMHCLQSRLLELRSLAEVFAMPDDRVVEHAVASTAALVDPAECMYVGAGSPSVASAEDSVRVGELQLVVARAKAMGDTGHHHAARELAREAAQGARDLADRPLEAEALLVAAHVERDLLGVVERNDAELTAYSAVLAAEAAHRPDLLARGLVEYLAVTVALGRHEQTWKWERRAREAVGAIGSPPELEGRIELAMALAAGYSEDRRDSVLSAKRALERFTEGGPSTRRWVSIAENMIGELVFEEGLYEQALPHYERALDIAVAELGPRHAWVASAHGNMAEVFLLSGRYEQAGEHFSVARKIREQSYGPTSVWVIHTIAHEADVALLRGEPMAALKIYRRALETRDELRRMTGDRPSGDAEMLNVYRDLQAWDQDQWLSHGIVLSLLELGQVEQARAVVEKLPEPRLPADHHHPDLIARLDLRGQVALASGDRATAIRELEQALSKMEAGLGPHHRDLVHPLLGLGLAHLERAAPAEAEPLLRRALEIHATLPDFRVRLRGDLRFALARVLADQSVHHAEAHELAQQAREDYLAAPTATQTRLETVDAWIASRSSASAAN